jgi:Tfp pilus assembly protein PilN
MYAINLLPWRSWQRRKQTRYFYAISIGSLLIHTGLWMAYLQQLQHSELRWQQKYHQINQQRIKQEREFLPISRQIKLSEQLKKRDLDVAHIQRGLNILAQTLPSEAVLIKIEHKNDRWMLFGLTAHLSTLFSFLEKIKKSKFFHKVTLTHLEQESHVRFFIQAIESN